MSRRWSRRTSEEVSANPNSASCSDSSSVPPSGSRRIGGGCPALVQVIVQWRGGARGPGPVAGAVAAQVGDDGRAGGGEAEPEPRGLEGAEDEGGRPAGVVPRGLAQH